MSLGSSQLPRRQRAGLTLVELLVVVTILVMLIGVTIPLMRSVRNGSQLEAAVRKIESVMNAAKALAITNGRPAGIVFVRDENNPSVAYEVALAESPEPYMGETRGVRVLVFPDVITLQFPLLATFQNGSSPPAYGYVRPLRTSKGNSNDMSDPANDPSKWFVRPGDRIRFSFRGPFYTINEVNSENLITLSERLPRRFGATWLEFQIFSLPTTDDGCTR